MTRTTRITTAILMTVIIAGVTAFAPSSSAIEIKRTRLKNGAVLLVSEQHQLPMLTIAIAFDAGSRRDPNGKAGLAALTADSLEQGSKSLSAAEFNEKVDFMGSSISVSADRDYSVATMTTLKKYQKETLHLLAQILENPGLRDADIERKRADQLADIKSAEEEPGYAARVAFVKKLYGNGPYGHPSEGFSNTVGKLSAEDVRSFYRNYYKMGSAVIAVAGDVDADQIASALNDELSGLSGTVPEQATPAPSEVPGGIHLDIIDRNVTQANLILGSGGIARTNPDYYKIQVMNYILGGGGFASRLTKVVRSQAGLAYSVGSGFQAGKFPGSFVVILQTKNASADEAMKLVLQQLARIREQPVSDADLASAKKYLVGSFPLKLDRQSEIVAFMLEVQLYGLGLDYADRYPKLIDAVSAADVQDVARKYIHPNALDVVAVADQPEAKINVASIEPQQQPEAPASATHAPPG